MINSKKGFRKYSIDIRKDREAQKRKRIQSNRQYRVNRQKEKMSGKETNKKESRCRIFF